MNDTGWRVGGQCGELGREGHVIVRTANCDFAVDNCVNR